MPYYWAKKGPMLRVAVTQAARSSSPASVPARRPTENMPSARSGRWRSMASWPATPERCGWRDSGSVAEKAAPEVRLATGAGTGFR